MTTTPPFTGWPAAAPALLAALAADNTEDAFAALRERYDAAVHGPTRALAAALGDGFGAVRVLRPRVDRRFRPHAPPFRTDTGVVATTADGTPRSVVLSATGLAVAVGTRRFDPGQLGRYRAAVGPVLAELLTGLDGWERDPGDLLARVPRGHPPEHPHADLLRLRGLQLARSWPVDDELSTVGVLDRIRAAWTAAAPLAAWLDEHVGPPLPPPRAPRPPAPGPEAPVEGAQPATPRSAASTTTTA